MKATIILEAAQNKIDLLMSIAHEMGIAIISPVQNKAGVDEVTHVSEPSLSDAWDSEEDKRWDSLYNK